MVMPQQMLLSILPVSNFQYVSDMDHEDGCQHQTFSFFSIRSTYCLSLISLYCVTNTCVIQGL